MIAVIADDFSGAAEIAGVGLRYGLRGEVQTEVDVGCEGELVVVDTDTRWRQAGQAAGEVGKAAARLERIGPEWVYKKVDSVLRGPVAAEVEGARAALGKGRVVLVPANPSLGRQVRQGRYFVDGKPIDQTGFANDPEYPARSCDVRDLLGASESDKVIVAGVGEGLPAAGIVVGDASCKTDLMRWAECCDDATLAAGGAEFFEALLETKGYTLKAAADSVRDYPSGKGAAMFVCTSTSANSKKAVELARGRNVPVAAMPAELLEAEAGCEEYLERWAEDAAAALQQSGRVIVTIEGSAGYSGLTARRLCGHTAALVEKVVGRIAVPEVYIEGGAAASATARRLGWKRFCPCCELAAGVVRMRVLQKRGQYLTIKPGSYRWPDNVWPLGH